MGSISVVGICFRFPRNIRAVFEGSGKKRDPKMREIPSAGAGASILMCAILIALWQPRTAPAVQTANA